VHGGTAPIADRPTDSAGTAEDTASPPLARDGSTR
jgi:hypothetical protein